MSVGGINDPRLRQAWWVGAVPMGHPLGLASHAVTHASIAYMSAAQVDSPFDPTLTRRDAAMAPSSSRRSAQG
jgi:hypothetical protein